jgi:hypothetical protein
VKLLTVTIEEEHRADDDEQIDDDGDDPGEERIEVRRHITQYRLQIARDIRLESELWDVVLHESLETGRSTIDVTDNGRPWLRQRDIDVHDFLEHEYAEEDHWNQYDRKREKHSDKCRPRTAFPDHRMDLPKNRKEQHCHDHREEQPTEIRRHHEE